MVRVLLEPPASTFRSRRRRGWSSIRWVFLVLAVAGLGYSGYAFLESRLYQAYEEWSFDRDRTAPEAPSSSAANMDKPAVAKLPGEDTERRSLPLSDSTTLGRIVIPRLKIKAIVKEGVDKGTLRRAVGHVPETVRPGTPGNIGLAAHRDTFFRGLRDVRKRDRIVVETVEGKYEYEVESTRVVMPEDTEVLAPTKESVLTLVTCYPFNYIGEAPKRFIVRARQVAPGE